MKALVLGAGGQLGSELVRLLGEDAAVTHRRLSITNADMVEALIASRRPDVVFNCAAYNAVDRAESEPDLAFAVNAEGPSHVAGSCRGHGCKLVHYSTNFVFDGEAADPYVETDQPNPQSVYARSKLEGERRVLESGGGMLVVRTAAVFGGPRSFPGRIVERARAGEAVRVVSDQRVNPTFARDLAAASLELVEQRMEGIVHAVSGGCASWDEFARAALADVGLNVAVESIATGAYQAAAARPVNGCLASRRFHALRPWREALREWAREVRNP